MSVIICREYAFHVTSVTRLFHRAKVFVITKENRTNKSNIRGKKENGNVTYSDDSSPCPAESWLRKRLSPSKKEIMVVINTDESGNNDKSITKVVENMTHAKSVPMIVENDVGS